MSNMLKWAEQELKLAGYDINDPEDGPNRWLAEGTLELLKVFSEQGHSGTAHMMKIGREAGVPVYEVKE